MAKGWNGVEPAGQRVDLLLSCMTGIDGQGGNALYSLSARPWLVPFLMLGFMHTEGDMEFEARVRVSPGILAEERQLDLASALA